MSKQEFTPDEQAFIDAQTEVLLKQAVVWDAMKEEELATDKADAAAMKIRDDKNPDMNAVLDRAKVLFEAAFAASGLPKDHEVIKGARQGLAAAREMMDAFAELQLEQIQRGELGKPNPVI